MFTIVRSIDKSFPRVAVKLSEYSLRLRNERWKKVTFESEHRDNTLYSKCSKHSGGRILCALSRLRANLFFDIQGKPSVYSVTALVPLRSGQLASISSSKQLTL